jgi:hypothetical protein|tara:strand:- start:78 stop:611 length:534 start_codon:yes stop_codon:yes gene_type:complete
MSYVETFYKKKSSDLDYLFDVASKYPSNRLKNNYKKFNQDYIAASIIYDENPIGFSLLQERDIFNGMARCLTRLFFPAPQTKSLMNDNYKYSDGLRPEIYQMLDQQIILGNKLGIKDFFISREDNKPLIMKNIFDGMIKNGYDWNIDTERKYRVINENYQWIIWTGDNLLDQSPIQK